jgi:hypothetical protein
MLLTFYTYFITFVWVFTSIYLLINTQKITYLKNVPATVDKPEPSVAIIIAVKDEEAELKRLYKCM